VKVIRKIALLILAVTLLSVWAARASQSSSSGTSQPVASATQTADSSAPKISPLVPASDIDESLKAAEKYFDDEAQAADAKLNPPPSASAQNPTKAEALQSLVSPRADDPPAPAKSAKSPMQRSAAAQELLFRLGADLANPVNGGIPVCAVKPGTPAAAAGLRAGDVINDLNGKKVRSLASLRSGLRDQRGQVTVGIVRKSTNKTVQLNLESPASSTSAISSGRAE
jgi:C-terminal processing protease CtpA/Prc